MENFLRIGDTSSCSCLFQSKLHLPNMLKGLLYSRIWGVGLLRESTCCQGVDHHQGAIGGGPGSEHSEVYIEAQPSEMVGSDSCLSKGEGFASLQGAEPRMKPLESVVGSPVPLPEKGAVGGATE